LSRRSGSGADDRTAHPAFDTIADRYDLLNRLLSLGLDRSWRRQAVRAVPPQGGESVLDVCAGTGDLTLEVWRTGLARRVIGLDRSPSMLALARSKSPRAGGPEYVLGDALSLPFPDADFDLVTIGFGLRNLPDRTTAIREIQRVLRPGGRLLVLEFCPPGPGLWAGVAAWYLNTIVPALGAAFGRHPESYRYLRESVNGFPPPAVLRDELEAAGFAKVGWRLLWPGLVAYHHASRPLATRPNDKQS